MSLAALIKKGSLRGFATATPATSETGSHCTTPAVATVATVAVAATQDRAANDPGKAAPVATVASQAPYWPNTQHANDSELDTMEARLMIFKRRGMDDAQADQLADKLLQADREQTGQSTCLLCKHFNPSRKTCGNFRSAGVGQEVGELAAMLQRCPGYATGTQ